MLCAHQPCFLALHQRRTANQLFRFEEAYMSKVNEGKEVKQVKSSQHVIVFL